MQKITSTSEKIAFNEAPKAKFGSGEISRLSAKHSAGNTLFARAANTVAETFENLGHASYNILTFIPNKICATPSIETDPEKTQWIEKYIETVPDFPKPGIQFKCYPELLKNPKAFHRAIQTFAKRYQTYKLDAIVGLDSRGFIFGTALAYEMNLPFVMVRKAGKLPRKVEKIDYKLEYGKNSFEIEVESLKKGNRVLIVDDLLATGGTANAAGTLVERLGAKVAEVACLIELEGLHGRKNLKHPFYSLITVKVDE